MNKIIFLDIDGVLNSIESAAAISKIEGKRIIPGPTFVEPPFTRENLNWSMEMVCNLKEIVKETGAMIVITSSWREKFQWAHLFIDMFAKYGWMNAPVSSCTPMHLMSRGEEVDEWIKIGNSLQAPITEYVIIDDEDDYSGEQLSHLVLTNKRVGLTAADARFAIKLLNKDESSNSI